MSRIRVTACQNWSIHGEFVKETTGAQVLIVLSGLTAPNSQSKMGMNQL